MPRRPNYRQERSERTRNKQARQQEKLQKKSDHAAQRKALQTDPDMPAAPTDQAENEDDGKA